MAEAPLVEDILFLACTRPAMVWGAPMEAMAINIMATSVLFLAAHNLAFLLVAPALHLVFRAITRTDPNAFRVLRCFLDTKARSPRPRFWGGSSMSPLRLARGRHV
ncbi:type IV secretion system protein VirB3 [Phenylobacterium aquaticum]|uniref:type IV secretion system protein VirB3 n=1 Tax=Phenylobacterium aquaticum TaxID=1763816 RepID=UPI001F5DD7CC|nr:type IV secretion system protein VirB3 [Phenylobacterium aquaticum]MCI3135345.1 type IV secretion system protein VirB3 [Phenylobacterium aquaticum]